MQILGEDGAVFLTLVNHAGLGMAVKQGCLPHADNSEW